MKSIFALFLLLLKLSEVLTFVKILYDPESKCSGLVCDYSYISWREKIEILHANNLLRNDVVSGKYDPDIFLSTSVNKLAWSEKLAILAQDEANKCPDSKMWLYNDKNGRCEFVSAKRSREITDYVIPTYKNLTSFITENKMLDFGSYSNQNRRWKTFRRNSAFTVGCGYVFRYSYEKTYLEHFVCLYCYIHSGSINGASKYDDNLVPVSKYRNLTSNQNNNSCNSDCMYEKFTCDREYDRLCSYDSKDGNIEQKQKSNSLCPNVNLLTGTILLWNLVGSSFVCLLASVFVAITVLLTTTVIFYFAIKNYRRWRKLITNDTESSSSSSAVAVQLSSAATKNANENSVTVERDDDNSQIENIVVVPRELLIEIESNKSKVEFDDKIAVANSYESAKTNAPSYEMCRRKKNDRVVVDRTAAKSKKNILQVRFELKKKNDT